MIFDLLKNNIMYYLIIHAVYSCIAVIAFSVVNQMMTDNIIKFIISLYVTYVCVCVCVCVKESVF